MLAGHSPFDTFDDRRNWRAVVFKLFGAIGNLDAGPPAAILVVGTFIGILKPAPTTDVVHQNNLEVSRTTLDILDQFLQRDPAINTQAAFTGIGIGAKNLDATSCRIFSDFVGLVFSRVLLVFGRHPDVFDRLQF